MNGRMRFLLLQPLVWASHRQRNGLEWDGNGQEDPVEWEEDYGNGMDLRWVMQRLVSR